MNPKIDFHALIEIVDIIVIVIDKTNKIIFMNQHAISALQIENYLGKNIDDVLTLTNFKGFFISKNERNYNNSEKFDPQNVVIKGKENYISIMHVSRTKNDDRVIYFLNESKSFQLEESKSDFVSLASHQLRTPISALSWNLSLLANAKTGTLNEKQFEYIQVIKSAISRMNELITSLLNISRLETDTLTINPKLTDLRELAQKVLVDLENKIIESQIELRAYFNKDLPHLAIDYNLFYIILTNIINNAVDYSPAGTLVELTMSYDSDMIMISLRDRGYGIPKDELEKVFTKLYRASNIVTRNTTGSGIGLYLVKRVLDICGGTILINSIEGKGTIVTITIPRTGMIAKDGTGNFSNYN